MSYEYSENILVQESAGHLLERKVGFELSSTYSPKIDK